LSADAELPFAWGGPSLVGVLRAQPEDFFVEEDLGIAPDGAGEHVFVRVEKRGANTDWVARELARIAGVRPDAVNFAGLKDRHAVTRQTFSVHLPGKREPDWSGVSHAEFRVLEATRHSRKLKRGALKGNRFRIVLRHVEGERAVAERILAQIAVHGVPNYFGEQRFGREAGNVQRSLAMFAGRRVQRHERSLLLSAARSQLFNCILSRRVRDASWNGPLQGDVWMLGGTHSIFGPEPLTPEIAQRCASGDISPTGALWGAGELRSRDSVAALESAVAEENAALARGLVDNGLEQERRALVLRPRELNWQWRSEADIEVSFYLSSGAYATVVLREIAGTSRATEASAPAPE
jgi:tRNA pseudouridine13 synthase